MRSAIIWGLLCGILYITVIPFACAHPAIEERIATLTEKIAQDPQDASLYLRRAELQRIHQQRKAGLSDLEQAQKLDAKLHDVYLEKALLHFESSEFKAAKEMIDHLLKLEPKHVDGLIARGRILRNLDRHLEAAADFKNAIALTDRPDPELYLECAQAFAAAGNHDLGLVILEQGMQALGPLMVLQNEAIDLEISLKRYDSALQRLQQQIESVSRKENFLLRKAQVLELAGRKAEAQNSYREARAAISALAPHLRTQKAVKELEAVLAKKLGTT